MFKKLSLSRIVTLAVMLVVMGQAGTFVSAEETVKIPAISSSEVAIIRPAEGAWLNTYAAEELAKYLGQISGKNIRILEDTAPLGDENKLLVLGNSSSNRFLKKLQDEGKVDFSDMPAAHDGFLIKSLANNGENYLVLSGRTDIATLYSVYHYLERFCKVGFFQDGEHIPHDDNLPFSGINVTESSRFTVRLRNFPLHRALRKFHCYWWDIDEWKKELDWMAKKKINMAIIDMDYNGSFAGIAAREAFPEIGRLVPDRMEDPLFLSGGWPIGLVYPEEYRTELTKEILQYGRSRGIRFVYSIPGGFVPCRYRELHPELKYVGGLGQWDNPYVHPDDPMYKEVTKRYFEKVIELFGTDHYYLNTPFAETSPGRTVQEALSIKTKAALGLCNLLKEIDPQAKWLTDTWDMYVNPQIWTRENIQKYLNALPSEMVYLYSFEDVDPLLSKEGNVLLHDLKWAFAVLHSYGGDDQMHGDIDGAISKIKQVAGDPAAGDCTGLFIAPELTHHDVMYTDFQAELAWAPVTLNRKDFLFDYARRRYSNESRQNMLASFSLLVDAMYTGDWNRPLYKSKALTQSKEEMSSYLRRCEYIVALLRQSVSIALEEKGKQKENELYESDLVGLTKAYLGELSNYYLTELSLAFKEGDKVSFEESAKKAKTCLDWIENILSTRPDYSLQDTIDRIMQVKGTRKEAEAIVKRSCINQDYTTNDVYEQMHYYYKPRVDVCISLLRKKLAEGKRDVGQDEIKTLFEHIASDWETKPIRVADAHKYHGTTIDAITRGFEALQP